MAFCEKCGNQLTAGTAFCPKCGARAGSPAPPNPISPPVTVVPPPTTVPTPATPVATADSGGCGKVLLIVGVIVLLCVGLGIAGVVYVGYRAKKKVDEIKQNINRERIHTTADKNQPINSKNSSLLRHSKSPMLLSKRTTDAGGSKGAGLLDNIFGKVGPLPMYVDDVPESFMAGNSSGDIVPGILRTQFPHKVRPTELTRENPAKARDAHRQRVAALQWRRGRYRDDRFGRERQSYVSIMSSTGFETNKTVEGTKMNTSRTQCRTDLDTARIYITEHRRNYPNIFPGTTHSPCPSELFRQVKSDRNNPLGISRELPDEITGRLCAIPLNGAET